jgi:hypothetical protein
VLSVAMRVLSAAGGVLVLPAFTTLDWYAEPLPDSHGNSHGGASFADLRWLVAHATAVIWNVCCSPRLRDTVFSAK